MNGASTAQSRQPPIGEAGRNVIANVEQLRAAQGLSFRQLSVRLGAIERPILPAVLHRLSQGGRRVDADDLVAFAAVLRVSPADLLAPAGTGKPGKDHAVVRAAQDLVTRIEQLLAADSDPDTAEALSGYVDRALRRVQIEIEELLAETRKP